MHVTGRTCRTTWSMKFGSTKLINSFFHEKTVQKTWWPTGGPSAINPSIMAIQKRSGAAPNKSNTAPPGPIFK